MKVAHLRRLIGFGCTVFACSEEAPRTPSVTGDGKSGAAGTSSTAARGGRSEPGGGRGGVGSAGTPDGTTAGEGGETMRGDAGASDRGGSSGAPGSSGRNGSAGDDGNAGEGGTPDDDTPAPEPVCPRGLTWGNAERLSISMAGDDILQSVTPDGLTLVWANAGRLFVSDRPSTAEPFAAPAEIAEELGFESVALSADGLRLIGSGAFGFSETTRASRDVAFAAVSDEQPFIPFNAAVMGTPTDEVALEPLLSADASYLVYSYVSPNNAGERPTLYETEWLGQWSFGTALAGEKLLWSNASQRRIATGMSSDRLTLFYWDEREDELRAAWRPRVSGAFTAFEPQGPMRRAAPNGSCSVLYYSEEGTDDLDLFQAERD